MTVHTNSGQGPVDKVVNGSVSRNKGSLRSCWFPWWVPTHCQCQHSQPCMAVCRFHYACHLHSWQNDWMLGWFKKIKKKCVPGVTWCEKGTGKANASQHSVPERYSSNAHTTVLLLLLETEPVTFHHKSSLYHSAIIILYIDAPVSVIPTSLTNEVTPRSLLHNDNS